jgi:hypothetical protein
MISPLTTPNLIHLKDDYPGVYEDLQKMTQQVQLMQKALGGFAAPVADGGIIVTGGNGIIDVQIVDKHPEQGEDYFLERDTQPSFATAHTIGPLVNRNYRDSTVPGTTTYWRWYKSTKLGGLSNRVVFGNPPTGVASGNFSTSSGGPAPSPPQGSGQSQIPGYGYGNAEQVSGRSKLTLL